MVYDSALQLLGESGACAPMLANDMVSTMPLNYAAEV